MLAECERADCGLAAGCADIGLVRLAAAIGVRLDYADAIGIRVVARDHIVELDRVSDTDQRQREPRIQYQVWRKRIAPVLEVNQPLRLDLASVSSNHAVARRMVRHR